jgi:hypothetical protein
VAAKVVRKMAEKVWNTVQRYEVCRWKKMGNATIYNNMRAYGRRVKHLTHIIKNSTIN